MAIKTYCVAYLFGESHDTVIEDSNGKTFKLVAIPGKFGSSLVLAPTTSEKRLGPLLLNACILNWYIVPGVRFFTVRNLCVGSLTGILAEMKILQKHFIKIVVFISIKIL